VPKSYENPIALTKAEKRLSVSSASSSPREARERILALPKDHPERLVYRGSNLQDARDCVAKLRERIGSSG